MRIARTASPPGIGAACAAATALCNHLDAVRYQRSSGVAKPPGQAPGQRRTAWTRWVTGAIRIAANAAKNRGCEAIRWLDVILSAIVRKSRAVCSPYWLRPA